MAPYPDEVDVFSVPHSRMKQLVDGYSEKILCTDFSDYVALKSLLDILHQTFSEFKCHEQIENKYIMKKLKLRLKDLAIQDVAVCNCHSDNRLSEMLAFVKNGFSWTKKSESERQNFGLQLQHALEDFNEIFLPHMQEEEEVFQPMLIKYFEYEELKCLKATVIEEHYKWQALNSEKQHEHSTEDTVSESKYREEVLIKPCWFSFLPLEVVHVIFSYISPQELLKCSEVCKLWNEAAYEPQLWENLYPVHWARGIWKVSRQDLQHPPWVYSSCNTVLYDEDADVDESSDSETSCGSNESCEERKIHIHESHLLKGILHSMLLLCPNVVFLDVSYTNITDTVFKGCLRLPNFLQMTNFKTPALPDGRLGSWNRLILALSLFNVDFNPWLVNSGGVKYLKHLDFSGCSGLSDLGLYRLVESMILKPAPQTVKELCQKSWGRNIFYNNEEQFVHSAGNKTNPHWNFNCNSQCDICTCAHLVRRNGGSSLSQLEKLSMHCPFRTTCCCHTYNHETVKQLSELYQDTGVSNHSCSLEFLSLSGCYKITDRGLSLLADSGIFKYLQHLDVSGCWNITGSKLCDVVKMAPELAAEHLYYCDHIEEGPYPLEANGCQNLDCRTRLCCCN
ncbi:F-box/LRR-repeat protein 5-like isoform X2 [Tachypleus tridentatus]|uniref:F-box/LRR-repeat protein 5-like isoform X2 n=1 Tax=Tachypleus tridentatus TaxID=6853 RepID=UPI003FCF5F18